MYNLSMLHIYRGGGIPVTLGKKEKTKFHASIIYKWYIHRGNHASLGKKEKIKFYIYAVN